MSMKEQTWFDRLINWLLTPKYDCSKGKHRWGYKLSQSGLVYMDEDKVPEHLWHCLDCNLPKKNLLTPR